MNWIRLFIFCVIWISSGIFVNFNIVFGDKCVNYEETTRTIKISCGSFNLEKINQELNNSDVLSFDEKIWLLSANLWIDDHAKVFINSTDTDWLRIKGDSNEERYGIINKGNLIINNTKITSWNPATNDFVQQNDNGTIKRPYITSAKNALGSMNISNSEISHLGRHYWPDEGISYFSGNSKIHNNNIHHLWYGFYTDNVSNIIITNNHFHHNFKYGIDPHTKTYNLLIKNNTVHNTKGIGIVCSLDCHNIIIENNTVFNNQNAGIMFSRNMTNSIVRNNIIYDEVEAISISESYQNKIYGNIINSSKIGMHLKLERPLEYSSKFENEIYNNTIIGSKIGILINPDVINNSIHNNKIMNSESVGILISNFTNSNNKIYDNSFYNNSNAIHTKRITKTTSEDIRNLESIWCRNNIDIVSANGIQFLTHANEVINSETEIKHTSTQIIPAWFKNNVCWNASQLISQKDFELGMNYLNKKGIIQFNSNKAN